MKNKILRCYDCYAEFVFTPAWQKKFAEHGWENPIRCPRCREKRRKRQLPEREWNQMIKGGLGRRFTRHGCRYFRKIEY